VASAIDSCTHFLKSVDRTALERRARTLRSAMRSETVLPFGHTDAPREWFVEQP